MLWKPSISTPSAVLSPQSTVDGQEAEQCTTTAYLSFSAHECSKMPQLFPSLAVALSFSACTFSSSTVAAASAAGPSNRNAWIQRRQVLILYNNNREELCRHDTWVPADRLLCLCRYSEDIGESRNGRSKRLDGCRIVGCASAKGRCRARTRPTTECLLETCTAEQISSCAPTAVLIVA